MTSKLASPAGGVIVFAVVGVVVLSLGIVIGWNAALRMHPHLQLQATDTDGRVMDATHIGIGVDEAWEAKAASAATTSAAIAPPFVGEEAHTMVASGGGGGGGGNCGAPFRRFTPQEISVAYKKWKPGRAWNLTRDELEAFLKRDKGRKYYYSARQ